VVSESSAAGQKMIGSGGVGIQERVFVFEVVEVFLGHDLDDRQSLVADDSHGQFPSLNELLDEQLASVVSRLRKRTRRPPRESCTMNKPTLEPSRGALRTYGTASVGSAFLEGISNARRRHAALDESVACSQSCRIASSLAATPSPVYFTPRDSRMR
jgi:hypothetical protein